MDDLLKDVLDFLRHIQGSYKGSIGGLHDAYLPQLQVRRVDDLAVRVSARLSADAEPGSFAMRSVDGLFRRKHFTADDSTNFGPLVGE